MGSLCCSSLSSSINDGDGSHDSDYYLARAAPACALSRAPRKIRGPSPSLAPSPMEGRRKRPAAGAACSCQLKGP